jgi:acyl carrier protein phosphodiesterase
MNLLAHLHLSEGLSTATAAGNLLADYVRRVRTQPIDEDFKAGMAFHQAIDIFSERDKDHQAARKCIQAPYRRLAGVIVDVAFDYCLCRSWADFSNEPLKAYVARRIAPIQAYVTASGSPLGPLLDRAVEQGWLLSYSTPEGLQTTFRRVATRSRAAEGLLGAEAEIVQQLDTMERSFQTFYPRLQKATTGFGSP